MKHVISKITAFICALGIIMTMGIAAFAADTAPSVKISENQAGTSAQISLENVGAMIYSAQITLKIQASNARYTVTPSDSKAYGTVTSDGGNVTVYIDSTDLMDGNNEINLATLVSTAEMNISDRADVILVDRSMKSVEYDNAPVSVTKASNQGGNIGGNGGNGGGSIGGGNIGGGIGGSIVSQTTPPNGLTGNAKFTDVPDNHWAKASIEYVTEKGLFTGTGAGVFSPNTNMTRAMYVTVLRRFGTQVNPKWNITCDTPKQFDDIKSGEWYSDAVAWAGGTGLVNGVGKNLFAPDASVTREQIAVITVNFVKLCGAELPETADAAEFTDAADISPWAADAVTAAQKAGLLYGRETGEFAPQQTATRAEVAAILHRFAELMN